MPWATFPPTPQSARPKSKWSVTSSGSSARSDFGGLAEQAQRGRALDRHRLAAAAGPGAEAGRLGAGLDRRRAGVRPSLRRGPCRSWPTTRRSTGTLPEPPLAPAIAETERTSATASAHAAASRNGMSLGIEATLSSRVVMAGRGQVSWLPGWSAAPSRGFGVVPSGWRAWRLRLPLPGHSGGTAPVSHRTSLDHRPYVRGRVYRGRRSRYGRPLPDRAHRTPGRHTHWRVARRRHLLLRGGAAATLLAVVGPGLLAGLSDDDPAGITTYSILGAKYGYELLWVLALSTAALVVFHELGVRLGIVTGKGLLTLVRERYGGRAAALVLAALVIANTGTLCAEFAGVAAGHAAARRDEPLPQRAARRGRGLGAGPARELPPHRALPAGAQLGLRRLRDLGRARPPGLGRRRQGPRRSRHSAHPRRPPRRGGDGRNDAGAVGAGLHPVLRGRQAAAREGPRATSGST